MTREITVDARGRPNELLDRDGSTVWTARWDDRGLVGLRLRLPCNRNIELRRGHEIDLILGSCDEIVSGGEVIARVAAIDWSDPRWIPAVDRPTALPGGAGTAILNFLAFMAAHRGHGMLRYRGPYPTAALFGSLRSSFRIVGDEMRARAAFEQPLAFGTMREVDVDFIPAPHRWHFADQRVCVQLRDGLERVYVDGRAYTPNGLIRCLHRDGDGWIASFDVGPRRWCTVLALDGDARPRGLATSRPDTPAELEGLAVPDAVAEILRAAITERMPSPLRTAAAAVLAELPIVFGDAGFDGASAGNGVIVVHAAIAACMGSLTPPATLAVLLDVITPLVARLAQDRLASAWRA